MQRLQPYFLRCLTTIALLIDEVSQLTFGLDFPSADKKLTDAYRNTVPKELTQAISEHNIQLQVLPNSTAFPHTHGRFILIGEQWEKNPWEQVNAQFFPIAHAAVHLTQNHPHIIPLVDIAIIVAVPCILELYHRSTQYLFNTVLNKLNINTTTYKIVDSIRSVHEQIATSAFTQIVVTYALKAAYQQHIELQTHKEALKICQLTSPSEIQLVNSVLQIHTTRRAQQKKNWIEKIRGIVESVPLFNPHVDSIPLPPTQSYEMQNMASR